MDKKKTNFLTTLPGILSGVGAMLGGLVGVAAVINSLKSTTVPKASSPTGQATSENRSSPTVKFYCDNVEYQGKNYYATVANNPEINESKYVILWKLDNNYFGDKYPPEVRCQVVSKRFQNIYDRGDLKYIFPDVENWVPNQEIPVVCGVNRQGIPCKEKDLLFTLEAQDDPNKVVMNLINLREFSSEEPTFRGRNKPKTFAEGKRIYYDMSSLTKKKKKLF